MRVLLAAIGALALLDSFVASRGIIGLALIRSARGVVVRAAAGVSAIIVAAADAGADHALAGSLVGAAVLLAVSALRRLDPDARYVVPGAATTLQTGLLAGAGQPVCVRPRGPVRGAIVIAHGTGNDRIFALWAVVDAAVQPGWCVVTAHLPGHGRGSTDVFSAAAARERVAALASTARTLTAGGPVVLVGQSLGAAVSLDVLVDGAAPGRAPPTPVMDACVAVSAPLQVKVGWRVLRELAVVSRPGASVALRYGTLREVLPAMGRFRRDAFPIRTASSAAYPAVVGQALAGLDLPARLTAARGRLPPVLLVNGTVDGLVSLVDAQVYADALGATALDDATRGKTAFWWVRGVCHADPLLDPAVLAGMFAWLDDACPDGRVAGERARDG